MLGLQVLAGAGIAGQLLIAREIMQELVAISSGAAATGLYAPIAAFTAVAVFIASIRAVSTHQQQLLVELVGRYAFGRIVSVGSTVDFRRFESPEFYNQLQRAMSSGDFRISGMVTSVSQLISALLTTVAIAGVLFLLSPLLLVLVAVAAAPALLAAIINSRESYAFAYAMTPESRERAYVLGLMTSRAAAKEVRLLDLGRHLRGRYDALSDERIRQLRIFLGRRLRVSLLGGLASAIGMAVALGSLVLLLEHDRIGVATALTAGIAMQQLAMRLTAITGGIAQIIESGMFLDDYQAFIALAPSINRPSVDEAPEHDEAAERDDAPRRAPFDRVRLEGVSFTYPGAPIPALQDVRLEVKPGEVVALVGANGSGKTTLVKLICQLYEAAEGRVLWNDVDATTLPRGAVEADLTVLFQDYLAYHLSALDNIVFGRVDRPARMEDAIVAARRAGAHEFLSRLPQGYDTRMGLEFSGGRELSLGQWQRLALARAFFRDGSFLILDEPTASLDPRAERDLFAQIRSLAAGPLGAAHLPSLLEHALGRPDLRARRGPDHGVGHARRADGTRRAVRRVVQSPGRRLPRRRGGSRPMNWPFLLLRRLRCTSMLLPSLRPLEQRIDPMEYETPTFIVHGSIESLTLLGDGEDPCRYNTAARRVQADGRR